MAEIERDTFRASPFEFDVTAESINMVVYFPASRKTDGSWVPRESEPIDLLDDPVERLDDPVERLDDPVERLDEPSSSSL